MVSTFSDYNNLQTHGTCNIKLKLGGKFRESVQHENTTREMNRESTKRRTGDDHLLVNMYRLQVNASTFSCCLTVVEVFRQKHYFHVYSARRWSALVFFTTVGSC